MAGIRGSAKSTSSANDAPLSSSANDADAPLSLTGFREIYTKADGFCKEVQSFVEEAGIPAMNELRYAGYHLLHAIEDNGSITSSSELLKARNHALRATYEAGEAGILCALDKISAFKEDYKNISVTSVIPDYTEILKEADAAKNRVVADREHSENREIDHVSLMDTFRQLKLRCHTLDISREELNKLVHAETREGRRFVTMVTIGIVTIVVTIGAAVGGVLLSRPTASPSEKVAEANATAKTEPAIVVNASAKSKTGH